MSKNGSSRRLWLTSLLAALIPVGGFVSPSCAAPPRPAGGYPLRVADGGYELQVLLHGVPVQTFTYAGESFVMGQMGSRYTLRVVNHTGRRIEAVVSVDGHDVLDGKPADFRSKRGYLVPAWGAADIEGWRLSQAEVAAFRFATVADSYAARTGSARDVGVIGVAVFPEQPRLTSVPRAPQYVAEPRDHDQGPGYEPPPTYGFDAQVSPRAPSPPRAKSAPSGGRAAGAEAAPTPSAPADAFAEEESAAPAARRRPGLATEFGEAVSSAVYEVSFARANPTNPSALLGVRYNDRDGLVALGIDVDGCCVVPDDLAWRRTATPFPTSTPRFAKPPTGWRKGCCMR
jgi:hypothetical protein